MYLGNVYSLSHMEGGGGGREGESDPNKSSSSGKVGMLWTQPGKAMVWPRWSQQAGE